MNKSHKVLTVCFVCLALTCASLAQRASIEGEVRDRDASLIPGVKITLLNLDQGLQRETLSNAEGYFSVPLLQPGRYLVTAQKTGFAVSEIQDLLLHVGEVRGLKIQMQVSAAPIQIEVSGKAQPIETVTPTLAQVVTGSVIRNAPLNGRDIRDLALLQPGVTPTDLDSSQNGVGTFNVAGARSDSVNYLLDGGLNNDLIDNRAVYVPNPDTVSEFRILTSNYPAEFGRNSGGVVSIATQSGTNKLHGTAFDFLRNDALDANSYFNKINGLPRNVLKRNQFGGILGGPIEIPKLAHGHDRYFFFVGYQGTREIQDLSEHDVPVFTPAELGGDFSHSGPNGSPDPNVAAYLQANPFFQPNPALAALAIIDPTRINSVAQNYIAAHLLPTSATGSLSSQQRYTLDGDELTGKFDFDIDASNKLAATLGWDRNSQFLPYSYSNVPGFPDNSDFRDYFANLAYTHIFNPSLLNEFRFTIERSHNDAVNPAVHLPTPSQLGIGITPDLPTGPTNLFFDTGLGIGFNTLGPQNFTDNTFTFSDSVSWLHGKHSLKMGGGFSAFQNNTVFAFMVNGQFVFLGQGGIGSQNSFADFLLGLPLQFTQSANATSNIRSKFVYGFIQDDWHVHKNLTLSLGLRYEYSTPKSDTQGRTFSVIPGQQSVVFPDAPVGMVFPGDPGAPTGVNFPDHNDWAPRVGFAWDVNGKGTTSVRGAFGVFYDILKGEDNLQFNGQPPFYSSAGFSFAPLEANPTTEVNYLTQPFTAAGVANPFPSRPPPHDINFAQAGFLPVGASGSTYIVDPHLRTPYTYQYHLTVQHQLMANTIMEASYVGNSSHGLTALQDINPFVLGTTNRVLNLTPGNSTCTADTAGNCSFGFLREFRNAAHANYNGLLLSLKKQFSDGGMFGGSYFTLAYTYAHNLDNASGFENRNRAVPYYNPNQFYSAADMDIRNRIVFSGGWELPFDRAWSGGPSRLTKGWQLFPIMSWRTGFPLDIFASLPSAFDFTSPGPPGAGDAALVRSNLVAPVDYLDPQKRQSLNGAIGNYWVSPNSFSNDLPSDQQVLANPSLRTYGTLPRNYLRGPGRFNIDLALSKTTPITERFSAQVRADFFNLINNTQFANPDLNISSPTFGQILYTNQARIIQLALRLQF